MAKQSPLLLRPLAESNWTVTFVHAELVTAFVPISGVVSFTGWDAIVCVTRRRSLSVVDIELIDAEEVDVWLAVL